MTRAHSNKSGVLDAHLVSVKMDIDDDDEDVVIAIICVANEGTTPVGNLDVSIISDKGAKYTSEEGITSLGPGVERNWTFEFQQSSGEWTFSLKSEEGDLNIGPFDCEFEFQAPAGRKLGNAIGSSLFSGAFDSDLGNFGQVQEKELIDSSQVVLTSYVAENMEGGGTKILTDVDEVSETEEGTPAQVEEVQVEETQVEDHLSLLTPINKPSTPAKGMPSGLPPTPPKGKPTGAPPVPPSQPVPEPAVELSDESSSSPPTGPPPSPPTGPPPSPPTGPPPSPPTGPPPSPPSGPPSEAPPVAPSGPPSDSPPTIPSGPPSEAPSAPPSGPPSAPPPGPPSENLEQEDTIDELDSDAEGKNLTSDNKFVIWFQSQSTFIYAGLLLLFILLNLMLSIFTSGSEKLSIPGSAGEERFAGWTDLVLIITSGALFGWGICDHKIGKDLSNKILLFKDRGVKNFYALLGIAGVLFLFIILNLKFALFSGGSEKISLPGSAGPAAFVGWLDLILLILLSGFLTYLGKNLKLSESTVDAQEA